MSSATRFDVRPLEALIGADLSAGTIAEMLGTTRRAVTRWRSIGLNERQADELAVRHLGVHPSVVWGAEWWRTASDDGAEA
jgi:hypothetical protein